MKGTDHEEKKTPNKHMSCFVPSFQIRLLESVLDKITLFFERIFWTFFENIL